MRYSMANIGRHNRFIKLSNGKVHPVSNDYPGVELLPSVKTVRHFFAHSTMHQGEAVYPVDPALRCVGEVAEDE